MDVRFRPMLPDDADTVVALHEAPVREGLFAAVPSAERVRESLAEPAWISRMIDVDGRSVGTIVLAFHADWLVEVRRIIVAEQGRGYGRAAMEWAKHFAFVESRAHRMYLEVVASNHRARRLYEGAGFVLEGTWREGFRDLDGGYADLCAYGLLRRDLNS